MNSLSPEGGWRAKKVFPGTNLDYNATVLERIYRYFTARPHLTLALAVVGLLGPFLDKPFHIDDPLFIRVAQHIWAQPLDPFGFSINWYGAPCPMWDATENPPVACYFLALVGGALGWSEVALHLAFLLPALAVGFGTYRLAKMFCRQPLFAALATVVMPAFVVSGTTLMCDMLMLAFWTWAMVFWLEGLKENRGGKLLFAALLMTLAMFTKYFGFCVVPLLVAWSLARGKRFKDWAGYFLLPLAALAAYQWWTREVYGLPLFSAASSFALSAGSPRFYPRMISLLQTLTFTGGCLAMVMFLSPQIWSWRKITIAAAITAGGSLAIFASGMIQRRYPWLDLSVRPLVEIQIIFWAIGGVMVLLLVVDEWWKRDADGWLPGLWVAGTFLFAALFNWTVNGRTILPMAPAVGILLARRLPSASGWWMGMALGLSAALALLVARADYFYAATARAGALQVLSRQAGQAKPLWFQGHWGFQAYLEVGGARAMDLKNPTLKPGDRLAIHLQNTSVLPPATNKATVIERFDLPSPRWLATWNRAAGAGFYAGTLGPLPFGFGRMPPEEFVIYQWSAVPLR